MRHPELIVLLFISLLFCMANTPGYSQQTLLLSEYEAELISLGGKIWRSGNDSAMTSANSMFRKRLGEVLRMSGAYSYPFDSLKQVSHLKPSDDSFRIWTWNLPLSDGTFRYFGFIETRDGRIFNLESNDHKESWQDGIHGPEQWYGAIYYTLIERRSRKQMLYTLLGWDGCDPASDRKIIEAITFDNHGRPVFGSPVFKTADGIRNRVIIDYAEKGNVLLRYDKQTLLISKGNRIRKSREWMIVTDRLIPSSPSMKGIRKYYVPSGDTYDAYIFRDGTWIFAEDIFVSNPSSPKRK